MIEVTVRAILGIISLVGGHREQIIKIEENSNVSDLIEKLIGMYGEDLRNKLLNESKEVKLGIVIFLNGRNILALDGLSTTLDEGDDLLIFPPVGGG